MTGKMSAHAVWNMIEGQVDATCTLHTHGVKTILVTILSGACEDITLETSKLAESILRPGSRRGCAPLHLNVGIFDK
jgi:hypothetical protein